MSQHGCPERLSNRSKGFMEDGGSQPTMELLVETLTGTAFEMTVSPSDTIFAIKSKIFRVEGIPVSQQHLVYNLKELEDSCSLRDLSIGSGARLRLVLGMRGGPVSTRRLPPPAPAAGEPWPDIDRLFHSTREEVEWSQSGCKVTVLVFRDGERVNMVRVRENNDGTYSPLDANKYSAPLSQVSEPSVSEPAAGALRENAVTMGKMLELRRRMQTLSLRPTDDTSTAEEKAEIQKTRSEEALPTHLRDEPPAEPYGTYDAPSHTHDAPYTRYSYEFPSRYTLLPPIGARDERPADTDTRQQPLQRRQSRREAEGSAILEECVGGEQCRAAPRAPHLQPVSQDLGELVGGCAWRGHSASALQLRAGAAPSQLLAPFSSSTSELESLQRSSRMLPGLSRARPREHLHLSDEGLHLRRDLQHTLYMRREASQPNGAEDRLYNRREVSQPEDRLYNRRENPQLTQNEDRLYMRKESNPQANEDRLYMRKEINTQDSEDRLFGTESEDRLYMRKETNPNEDRLFETDDRVFKNEDIYMPRTESSDRLYMRKESNSQTTEVYMQNPVEDCLYMPEDRLFMHRELIAQCLANDDRLYISKEPVSCPPGFEDHLYLRRDMTSQLANEERLYMRRDLSTQASGDEERVFPARGTGAEGAPPPATSHERGAAAAVTSAIAATSATSATSAISATSAPPPDVKEKKIRVRCGWCRKRLSVATVHRCRCGGAWCAQHRYKEVHGCAWDYKAEPCAARDHTKLPKI